MPGRSRSPKQVETLVHDEAKRTNIPTAEYRAVMDDEDRSPVQIAYARRNRDLDPQLVWRGKDEQDQSDLMVQAPPLFIQEKLHPKVLIDDLRHRSQRIGNTAVEQLDLFADFNGLPDNADRTDFYQHQANWSNRMILGDSLSVMASLAEREGLCGKVQCIYIDPPYGIKFNSNFQWSTTSRDVRDGNRAHITREPEQVKAFRDTWRDGIHSYLTYLRDRLTVARDLLSDSGSIFVQIGDENVHRVRALMEEVFGAENLVSQISFVKTTGFSSKNLSNVVDHILWYARSYSHVKYRDLYTMKEIGGIGAASYRPIKDLVASTTKSSSTRLARSDQLTSQGASQNLQSFVFRNHAFSPPPGLHWKTTVEGLARLNKAERIFQGGNRLRYLNMFDDFSAVRFTNNWTDTGIAGGFASEKIYVVQTTTKVIQRCILMATDPGDLVLDPTCGSGTTAYVAEQWGRRWITIDTSRVALALARARIMGARYPWYLLADSPEGQIKEAEVERRAPSESPTYGDIRQGFVYERVPHITLRAIANNAEIDVIWEQYKERLAPLRDKLSVASGQAKTLEEWEVLREPPDDWPAAAHEPLAAFWETRIARQKAIDASIAAKADFEYLYDKPYQEKRTVRVAGPFTVESLSRHRMLGVDEHDELIDGIAQGASTDDERHDFASVILEHLRTAGVQQAQKQDRISFSSVAPWPGDMICADGRYLEGDSVDDPGVEKRAAILIGPEFGTVSRPDLVMAAREAAEANFDVLIACAFNFEAHVTEFNRLGRIPILKARMNAELHMAGDLKNTGKGNLFVIFGEPDIEILDAGESGQIQVKINGVDVFHPNTGEVRSDGPEGIACWFVDTDYNEESFFVRHAYFLGANDPYKALKTTLKAEIDAEAWATLNSDTSRPFDKPESGRIAVKVINHLGDEVMKVFRVE